MPESTSTDTDTDPTSTSEGEVTTETLQGELTLTVVTTEVSACEKRCTITVEAASVKQRYNDALKDLRNTVALPGFRPGHAPRKLVERRFKDRVEAEVRDGLQEDGIRQLLDEKGWDLIGRPSLEHDHDHDDPDHDPHAIDTSKDYDFTVTIDIRPDVVLPDFKKLSVERPPAEVQEVEIQAEIVKIRQERGQWVPIKDRGADANDMVVFDADFLVGDEVVHKSEGASAVLPPSSETLAEGYAWVAKFTGKKPKGKFTFKGPLPPDLPSVEHRKVDGVIKVTVRAVKEMELPEFDAEWLKELGVENEEELTGLLRQQLQSARDRDAESVLDDRIVGAVLDAAPFELPRRLVDREAATYLQRYEVALRNKKVEAEEIPKLLEEAHSQRTGEIERGYRRFLLLDEIAKRKKIFVTEGDVAGRVAEMAAHYGKTVPELEAELEQRDMLRDLRHELKEEKVRTWLREQVEIKDA
jgi:trigger factor